MKHRNLVDDVGYALPAVDDILDRGSAIDWSELAKAVIDDPHGEVAENVLTICHHHYMHGTSALWSGLVKKLRGETIDV